MRTPVLMHLGHASKTVLSLNLAEIDTRLPGHGLQLALHEIAPADHRGNPAAWGFLLALAKIAAGRRPGPVFWPLMPGRQDFGLPYGPGLKRFGFDGGRFLFASCASSHDVLWAMEEALRAGGLAAVIGCCPPRMNLTMSRRLQLAAEKTQTPIFLLRSPGDPSPSAARTRWRVSPVPARRNRFGLIGTPRWHVALERARGGGCGEWILEWNHDALSLRLSSPLADRTVLAGKKQKFA